jgi:hypothetical protein
MKILHLPSNIASQMRITVHVLREMGMDARGLTGPSPFQNSTGLEILPRADDRGFIPRKLCALRRAGIIMKAIVRADVIHWHGEPALPLAADLRAAKALGRRLFVEFWGSDIRDPELECAENPHYRRAWESGVYECSNVESRPHSHAVQHRFAAADAGVFNISPAMARYHLPGVFRRRYQTGQRVLLDEYPPAVPSAVTSRPLIVHAPSAPGSKGTPHVLAAVEKLRTEYDFDFQLIHGMSPSEARAWISRCDIFVDQLIVGEYGVAGVEAMALGKPMVCFIKPSVRGNQPDHLPVISADPETIVDVLRDLIKDGPRRQATGEASRAWVEEHHDARKIVARIAEYYQAA